ncbi:MAG: tetraacyldisaccharide 4'-kinase [Hyphomicrobiales bacterium]
MSLTPPPYWWPNPGKPQGFGATLKKLALVPASFIYGRVVARRMAQEGAPGALPVVCIGNLVAGGAGKTPTSLAVYDVLEDLGLTPAFVTRGYGGSLATTSFRVDPDRHLADEVGDEPLLLARRGETFVGPDRLTSIASAAEIGATCTIFDDGLQNPAIVKNLTIAVVDGRMGVGNGLSHPAGPLRAPVAAQLPHVDFIIVIGKGMGAHGVVRQAAKRGKPVLSATLEMDIPEHLFGQQIYAFCGIGHPPKFFDRLKEAGLNVVKEKAYPDHHAYTTEDARELVNIAKERGAVLVTTEKDGMRFQGHSGSLRDLDNATTQIPAKLVFEDPGYLRSLLRNAIRQWRRDMVLVEFD